MTANVDALLAAIDEDPEDEGRYLVLADALTAAGDPHGELIVLQHTIARQPNRELLRAEQAARRAAWPEHASYRAAIYKATWRLGFLDLLEVDGNEEASARVVDTLANRVTTRSVRTIRAATWRAGMVALSNLRELVINRSMSSDVHELAALPRLESLGIGFHSFEAATIASMPGALRSLEIRDAKRFGDEHVAATASISTLRRLSLCKLPDITDACAARLGENVRDLSVLECPRITSGIVRQLAERPLEGLRLGLKDALDGEDLGRLHDSLERLEAYSVANPEAALAAAARQPRLRELEISCYQNTPVTAESVARVLALPELRRLTLRCNGGLTGSAKVESRVEHVTLDVADCAPALIASIASSSLRVLALGKLWSGHDEILVALAPSSHLASLSLGDASITDANLRHLHALTALETLDLNNCMQVTSRGVIELACALPALRTLCLDQTHHQVGIDSLAGLEHHPSLAKLDLANTRIRAADLEIAATLPALQSLRLMRTSIRDADLVALLPVAPTLRHLDIDMCGITKAAIYVLRQFQALESLNLLNSSIDKASFAELRAALPACRITGEGWEPDEYPPSDPFEK